jgi:hypothetical protein
MTRLVASLLFVLAAFSGIAEAGAIPAPVPPVPEPVTALVLGAGLAALGIRAYRRRR